MLILSTFIQKFVDWILSFIIYWDLNYYHQNVNLRVAFRVADRLENLSVLGN